MCQLSSQDQSGLSSYDNNDRALKSGAEVLKKSSNISGDGNET